MFSLIEYLLIFDTNLELLDLELGHPPQQPEGDSSQVQTRRRDDRGRLALYLRRRIWRKQGTIEHRDCSEHLGGMEGFNLQEQREQLKIWLESWETHQVCGIAVLWTVLSESWEEVEDGQQESARGRVVDRTAHREAELGEPLDDSHWDCEAKRKKVLTPNLFMVKPLLELCILEGTDQSITQYLLSYP